VTKNLAQRPHHFNFGPISEKVLALVVFAQDLLS
jgi:hypothetical protein